MLPKIYLGFLLAWAMQIKFILSKEKCTIKFENSNLEVNSYSKVLFLLPKSFKHKYDNLCKDDLHFADS